MQKDSDREKKDAVTVGLIRKRYEARLEQNIGILGALIRQGYYKLSEAKTYLEDAIGKTLTDLQNIDSMAGTEVMFPQDTPEVK